MDFEFDPDQKNKRLDFKAVSFSILTLGSRSTLFAPASPAEKSITATRQTLHSFNEARHNSPRLPFAGATEEVSDRVIVTVMRV